MTKPSDTPAAQAVGQVSVVLAKPHTHAGKDYAAGATITVTPKQKAFLEEKGVLPTPVARVESLAEEN